MAIITTGSCPKALKLGVRKWFGAMYDEHTPEFPVLFTEQNSSENFEEDVQIVGFGLAPVKHETRGVDYFGQTQGWTKRYVHIVYGLGFIVSQEEFDDNKYEAVSKTRARAMAFSLRQTKENVHANIINRMTDTDYTGGDGSVLIATDHAARGGTWSNELDPAADISETALEDLCIQIMGANDDQGMKISLIPQSLHVPRQSWFEANRILKSTLQHDTALNALNVLKSTNALPGGIHVNHYFTDSDAFGIKTNCPNGLMSFQRRAVETTNDGDFDSGNLKFKATERYSCGWTDPRGYYASIGA